MKNSGYIPEEECIKWLKLLVNKEMKSSSLDGLHLLSKSDVIGTFYPQIFQDLVSIYIVCK